MANKITWIRTIYIYLFSLVGLVLVIIAGVRFIDMGLKAWIFTKADDTTYGRPLTPELYINSMPNTPEKNANQVLACSDKCGFTDSEKEQVRAWLASYQTWKDTDAKIDYKTSERQRTAANSLAMLIIGLPLYFYHWRMAGKRKDDETV